MEFLAIIVHNDSRRACSTNPLCSLERLEITSATNWRGDWKRPDLWAWSRTDELTMADVVGPIDRATDRGDGLRHSAGVVHGKLTRRLGYECSR